MRYSILDGIIFGTACFGIWRGFVTGVIKEAGQLFGVFAAFAVALQVMRPLGIYMVSVINVLELPPEGGSLVAFIFVFVLVYLLVHIATRLLDRLAASAHLGMINKMLGGGFGAAKTLLILSVILIFIGQLGVPDNKSQRTSYLYGSVEKIAPEAWEIFAAAVPSATRLTRTVGQRFWEIGAKAAEKTDDDAAEKTDDAPADQDQ